MASCKPQIASKSLPTHVKLEIAVPDVLVLKASMRGLGRAYRLVFEVEPIGRLKNPAMQLCVPVAILPWLHYNRSAECPRVHVSSPDRRGLRDRVGLGSRIAGRCLSS